MPKAIAALVGSSLPQQELNVDPVLQGQIRTILAGIAGMAVAKGYIDAEMAGYAVGLGLYVITALWSWKSKVK